MREKRSAQYSPAVLHLALLSREKSGTDLNYLHKTWHKVGPDLTGEHSFSPNNQLLYVPRFCFSLGVPQRSTVPGACFVGLSVSHRKQKCSWAAASIALWVKCEHQKVKAAMADYLDYFFLM